jgi:hypothetical protein
MILQLNWQHQEGAAHSLQFISMTFFVISIRAALLGYVAEPINVYRHRNAGSR